MSSNPISNGTATMDIAASALKAQQARMRVIAENIANADTMPTTAGGDAYRRQSPVFEPVALEGGATGVAMTRVQADTSPFHREYNPGNPAADTSGYVNMPNVEPLTEAIDMREAQRAYEANLNVIENQRTMDSHTLEIIKK